jgi:hypothetical protein
MIRRDALPQGIATTSEFTASVLIIQDDTFVRMLYGAQLDRAGFDAPAGGDANLPSSPARYAAVLFDVQIPDNTPATRLDTGSDADAAPVMVLNGRLTVRVTAEAIVPGTPSRREEAASIASAALRRRALAIADDRPHAVATIAPASVPALATHTHALLPSHPPSAAHRWASYVLSVCLAPHDIRTLDDWARHVGTSHTTLRQVCRILGVRPHDARNLGRALFAIVHAGREHCPPTVLLDVADTRTLRAFLRKAGPEFRSARDMDAVNRFLDVQQFVEPDNQGLRILRELLQTQFADGMA